MDDITIIIAAITLLWLISGVVNALIGLLRLYKYEGTITAKIIDIEAIPHYYHFEKYYTYYPTYQYTVDEFTYESKSRYGTRKECFLVGGEVILHYDLNNPKKYVAGEKKFWIDNLIRHVMVALSLPFIYLICFLLSLIL